MESPICVVDAQTFTDHIHEIKSWIYNSQLRLIVPSSLRDNVEQLCNKLQEPKAAVKEPSRLKTLGKTAKKESPTFDANPKIAKAYLARLQAGKDYETGAFGRPIYEEEENHAAIYFATNKERYSTWKDVEDHIETAEPPTDRAESWAEKLRRKQNATNGNTDTKTAKGPVKPKLVAKTGADNSPWKVQKNAPTISGNEVPAAMRPMMTCCLWRIHESIHRNDENQIFVYTDQPSVRAVAQKLNIVVRSTIEIGKIVSSTKNATDLESAGELERDFGVRPVKPRHPIRKTGTSDIGNSLPNGTHESSTDSQEPIVEEQKESKGLGTAPEELPPNVEAQHRGVRKGVEVKSDHLTTAPQREIQDVSEDPSSSLNTSTVKDAAPEPIKSDPLSLERTADLHVAMVADTSIEHSLNDDVIKDTRSMEEEEVQEEATDQALAHALSEMSQEPKFSMESKSFADALLGHQRKHVLPLPAENKISTPERQSTPSRITSLEAAANKPDPKDTKTRGGVPKAQPVTANIHATPEDSDEEIVVFQPKRLSAQRKPPQPSSRPTTPNVQAQATPTRPSLPETAQHLGSSGKRHPSSKVPPKQKHGPKPGNAVNEIRPRLNPPVIDPDAFGRDFAVNTSQNVRGNGRGSLRGGRPRHSPQPSLFDTGPGSMRPTSSHRQRRNSPSRVSPKTSPKQPVKTPSKPERHVTPGHQRQPPSSATQKPLAPVERKETPEQKPTLIGTGRPNSIFSSEPRIQSTPLAAPVQSISPPPALNANAPIFQPGSFSSPFLSSPIQRLSPPQSTPPKQPPIGSGRPTSKSKLSDQNDTATFSSTALLAQEDKPSPVLPTRIPTGPRQQKSDFSRQPPQLPHSPPPAPNPGFVEPAPANITTKVNGAVASHSNGNTGPSSSFHPPSRGRGAARGGRPVKPSLFDPEIDHTRAYHGESAERKGTGSTSEVQYVLKSGSTREQARGRGKLWVG